MSQENTEKRSTAELFVGSKTTSATLSALAAHVANSEKTLAERKAALQQKEIEMRIECNRLFLAQATAVMKKLCSEEAVRQYFEVLFDKNQGNYYDHFDIKTKPLYLVIADGPEAGPSVSWNLTIVVTCSPEGIDWNSVRVAYYTRTRTRLLTEEYSEFNVTPNFTDWGIITALLYLQVPETALHLILKTHNSVGREKTEKTMVA